MKMRIAKVLASKAYTADEVVVLPILLRDPISALYIEVKSLNNGSTMTAHPVKSVSKVEVLDGSKVIHSLTGMEIQARQFYCLKQTPRNIINYNDNSYSTTPLVIPFGRFFGDPIFALDPARFSQLQLRVSVDIAAGGAAADSVSLDIDAYVFDEKKINPVGYLAAKEFFRYSLTSSAVQEIDLPRDRKLRSIILHSLYAAKQPYEQIHDFKVSEDNDRRVPYDLSMSHYLKLLGSQYGQCEESIAAITDTTGITFYVMPAYEVVAAVMTQGAAPYYYDIQSMNGGIVLIDGSTASMFSGIVKGDAPHSSVILPFGDLNDPDDWYDLRDVGSLRLKLTAGSSVGSGSDAAVVTEQVELY